MLGLARFRWVALFSVAACAAMGCGDDSATGGAGGGGSPPTTGGEGGVGGKGGQGGEGGQGGAPVECVPGDGVTLALTTLYFGQGNSGEWKSVGLNIDGLVSDENSTDLCQPNADGDPVTAYPDGDDGIDNSFGKNLLPILLTVNPSFAAKVDHDLATGRFNALMKMYCLPETGDIGDMTSKVFAGTDLGMDPLYDGTDVWPIAPEVLSDLQDPESSTLVFEHSSVTGQLFDSGDHESFILLIPLEYNNQTAMLKLTLHNAHLIMTLSDDRRSATEGVLAGVLDTEEFVDQVKKIGYLGNICGSGTLDAIIQSVRQASDIMIDGTQDPGQVCNGISFGVKLEMAEVQIGDVGPASPMGNACP